MAATFQMNMFQAESNDRQETPKTEKKPKAPKQAAPAATQSKINALRQLVLEPRRCPETTSRSKRNQRH